MKTDKAEENRTESRFWKVGKYLPMFSLVYETSRSHYQTGDYFRPKHFAAHMAYYIISLGALIWWGSGAIETGKLNPAEQHRIIQREERKSTLERQLWHHADTNKDDRHSWKEVREMYRKTGLKLEENFHHVDDYYEKIVQRVPDLENELSIKDLEKAVQSYEDEQNRDSDSLRDQEVD